MTGAAPRYLLHGLDTVACAYYLAPEGAGGIPFEHLIFLRESMRESKLREPRPVVLGSREFMLQPYGTQSGYSIVLTDEDFRIECGERISPSFYVTFRSQALWQKSAFDLHQQFMAWAESVSYVAVRPEGLSRVDFCFDYYVPDVDFDRASVVSLSSKDSQHCQDQKIQTLTYGKGDVVLRIYDKIAEIAQQSGKVWFFELWGCDKDVWRIEWQVRKSVLKRFDIYTFRDLADQHGDLLRYLAHEHDSLRVRGTDSNRSRWKVHPLWLDLQTKIAGLDCIGIYKACARPAVLAERLARNGISCYGYLKRVAAIRCVQTGKDTMDFESAMRQLAFLLRKTHEPLTWEIDVAKRVKEMELGEW